MYLSLLGGLVQRLGPLGSLKTRRETLHLTRLGLLCGKRRHRERKPGPQFISEMFY